MTAPPAAVVGSLASVDGASPADKEARNIHQIKIDLINPGDVPLELGELAADAINEAFSDPKSTGAQIVRRVEIA